MIENTFNLMGTNLRVFLSLNYKKALSSHPDVVTFSSNMKTSLAFNSARLNPSSIFDARTNPSEIIEYF